MGRWELVTSDEWIIATTECIVVSKKKVSEIRKELNDFFLQYRDELLHGNQGLGCYDKKCKVCYICGHKKKLIINHKI